MEKQISKQTVDQMVDRIMSMPEGTKIQLLAPVVRGRKGTHAKLLEKAKKSGYVRVRVDGNMYELTEEIILDKNLKHNIEIIVDRLIVKQGIEKRLTDSVESVLHLSEGLAQCRCDRRGDVEFQSELFLSGLWDQYRRDRTKKFFI